MADSRIEQKTLNNELNPSLANILIPNEGDAVEPLASEGTPASGLSPDDQFEVRIPVISIPSAVHPVENLALEDIVIGEPLAKPGIHPVFNPVVNPVFKARWQNKDAYFKKQDQPFISELEAANAEFYRFIAPNNIPQTKAIFTKKDGKTVSQGVISIALPGFVSIVEEPLTEADLQVHEVEERNLYAVLEKAEKKFLEIEKNITVFTPESAGTLEQAHEDFYADLKTEHGVSKELFDKFRVIKGAAIGLAVSFEFLEDDTHRNNLSKDGKRIDFGMSMWPVLFDLIISGLTNWAFRKPNASAKTVTKEDIQHFPNLINYRPFYWPTYQTYLTDSAVAVIKTFAPFSTNPFPSAVNLVYQKLEHNPVFKHYAHATFLEFILGNEDIYRRLSQLHIRPECMFEGSSVIDMLARAIGMRIQQFKNQLTPDKCFAEFMQKYDDHTFEQIKTKLADRNKLYENLITEIKDKLHTHAQRKATLTEINSHLALVTKDASTDLPRKSGILESLTFIEDYVHPVSPQTEKENQTHADERQLNLKLLKKNTEEISAIDVDVHQLQAQYIIYKKQIIDLDYLTTTYKNIAGQIAARAQAHEPEIDESTNRPSAAEVMPGPLLNNPQNSSFTLSSFIPSFFSSSVSQPIGKHNFLAIKNRVIKEMDLYINPGKFFLNGYYRTQKKLAEEIKAFCETMRENPIGEDANEKEIEKLRIKLEIEKAKLSSGCMFNTLDALLSEPIWGEALVKKKTSVASSSAAR